MVEVSTKEERIKSIAQFYYSKKEVQQAILEFCRQRETIPRYYEGFGKRPDTFEYPNEIFNFAKKGATSFHCSEEIWNNPLEISTDLDQEQFNQLRSGWDLLIDIDCKWFEYSKKAALSIIKSLEFHKIKNIGIKYSGSKGFHIIIPWKAFPKDLNEAETINMFPEWPRIVVQYLMELARPILEKSILEDKGEEYKNLQNLTGIKCENCNNLAESLKTVNLQCLSCKQTQSFNIKLEEKYKQRKCPECRIPFQEISSQEFYRCNPCNLDSTKNPQNFKPTVSMDIFEVLGLDVVLVSPRHLFRTPYSLHEKTSLASVVLDKHELENFQPKDANPMNVKIKNFLPDSEEGEATELLVQALDWYKSKQKDKKTYIDKDQNQKKQFQKVKVDKNKIKYPPSIEQILKGGIKDGRKRALFILMNYFNSLDIPILEIDKTIQDWNKKNKPSLKDGYIKSQFTWMQRQKPILPPNYDKDHYKAIGIIPTPEELKSKNPVSYTVRKFLSQQHREKENQNRKPKPKKSN